MEDDGRGGLTGRPMMMAAVFIVLMRVDGDGGLGLAARPMMMAAVFIMLMRVGMRVTGMSMRFFTSAMRPIVLVIHLLRQSVILGEAGVVAMAMAAAVGAGFRVKRRGAYFDRSADAFQHGAQHRIGFQLQIIGADFDRGMPIAEVVGGAHQVERGGGANAQDRFTGRDYAYQCAVVGDQ